MNTPSPVLSLLGDTPAADPTASPATTPRCSLSARRERFLLVAVLAALWTVPVLLCLQRSAVADADVGWHLRTGEWIIRHHAWPLTDEFSGTAAYPYFAYSWLFDVVLWGLYQLLGLRGIALLPALAAGAITVTLFWMLIRRRGNLLLAAAPTVLAAFALSPLFTPRPWLFSILLWLLEVEVLLTASRTRDHRYLLWLGPLFCVWANVHLHFVGGLVLLGLAAVEPWLARWDRHAFLTPESHVLCPWKLSAALAFSVGATLINPYHVRLYEVAWRVLSQSQLRDVISEAQSPQFRSAAIWLVLAVTLAASLVIGWRRQVRLWLLLAFGLGLYMGFRSLRETWMIVVMGVLIIGDAAVVSTVPRGLLARAAWQATGLPLLLMIAGCLPFREPGLEARAVKLQPVAAVQFLRAQAYDGPLFNPFNWGGYLIQHLPELPVSMDGRAFVYDEEQVLRNRRTFRGERGWRDDPDLARATVVLAPQEGALASLLEMDSAFTAVYRDEIAVVFRRAASGTTRPAGATP